MPKALILVADGSEEIEFVTPYDGEWVQQESDGRGEKTNAQQVAVLTRAGFEVTSVGVQLKNESYAQ
jgi:protein DJ-1